MSFQKEFIPYKLRLNRKILEKEYPNYKKHIKNTFEAKQQHVFTWWDEISSGEKELLLAQVASIDFQLIEKLFHQNLRKTASAIQGSLLPPHVISVPSNTLERELAEAAKQIGESSLRKGETAILTVAGGDGSRLGGNGPKGTICIAPISGKSIFQLHAEKIHALQQRYGIPVPWYIMTSETNNQVTQDFFQSHHFFGLDDRQVCFFTQGMLPVVDLHGKVLMNSKSNIVMSPNGHGGVIIALREKGILADMKRRGVRQIFYHQIDNVLIKMADPVFLGYHAGSKAEISLKVVKKRHAEEKVGIVGYIDGRLHIAEYSELSQEDMYARNGNGMLKYNAGSIGVHMIHIDFLEKVYRMENSLPYHVAFKKVSCLNEKGDMVNPEKNNAVKFESFIFDILRYVKQGIVMEVLREEEFSPVKNSEGNDSPATAKRDIVNLFGRWLRNTGISIPTDPQGNVIGLIEISPHFALDEEELRSKIDTQFQFDGLLNLKEHLRIDRQKCMNILSPT
ncbi:MAG: hypothetical protein AMXMBFR17_13970 [Candidatus Jettenia caeni]